MKKHAIGVFTFLVTAPVWALNLPVPTLIQAPVDKIFVIKDGFDNNDNVEVAITGTFRNSCYRADKGYANVDHKSKIIHVSATAYFYPQEICIDMLIPYIQVVKLGILNKGEYKVMPQGGERLVRKFNITEATTADPDDYLYTPVNSAFVEKDAAGNPQLHLRGQYPLLYRGCMKTQRIASHITPENVLVVQPIAAILPPEECEKETTRDFDLVQPLDKPLAGDTWLHVRTLNGNAYDQLIVGEGAR